MNQLLILDPDNLAEQRERGAHYLRMEAYRAALADFSHCLEQAGIDDDIETLRMQVSDLRMRVARLNWSCRHCGDAPAIQKMQD